MNTKEIDGVKYVSFADHNEMLLTAIRLERDACALICDHEMDMALNMSYKVAAGNCADKIRDRGD